MIALLFALLIAPQDPLVADQIAIDRGQVRVGPPLIQTFRLTNRSNETLTITEVKSSCGCLAPKIDHKTLAANESATLTVDVNTLSQPAGQVAWITHVSWHTKDSAGELSLRLTANLIAEVRVEPAAVAFQASPLQNPFLVKGLELQV